MKVVLYMRVSTDEQTVENQRYRLREYAEGRGWEVVSEYVDEGRSGTSTSRPGLDQMVQDLRSSRRGWEGILAYKLDRIGRSLPHLIQIMEEMKIHGVDLIFSDDPTFDTTTPHGRLMFTFFGAIAEYERALLKERQAEGIRRSKREGIHGGRQKIHGGKHQKVLRL